MTLRKQVIYPLMHLLCAPNIANPFKIYILSMALNRLINCTFAASKWEDRLFRFKTLLKHW
jgi:hypothetical protein